MHDTRKLMLSIMISKLGIDSRLADYCLDHTTPQGTIKHYLEFTYEDKVEAYNLYWDYIRNIIREKIEKKPIKTKVVKENDSNLEDLKDLKDLVEMLKNGFITQKQFEKERDSLY